MSSEKGTRIFNMKTGRTEFGGRRLWLVSGFAFGLALFTPALFGDPIPPCVAASLSTYDATGFQCIVDGYTLEDVTFSSSQTGGATLLTDSQITVDPTVTTGPNVEFDADFVSLEGQTEEYIFQYELDPVLPKITSASAKTGPGDPVTLTGQFCGNGTLGAYVAGQPTSCSGSNTSGIFPATLVVDGNNMSASATFPSAVTDLDSRLILDLDGASSITSLGSTATLGVVPEPSTSLFLAPGMLAFLWLRKRWLASGK
jgi:hypothetical protein